MSMILRFLQPAIQHKNLTPAAMFRHSLLSDPFFSPAFSESMFQDFNRFDRIATDVTETSEVTKSKQKFLDSQKTISHSKLKGQPSSSKEVSRTMKVQTKMPSLIPTAEFTKLCYVTKCGKEGAWAVVGLIACHLHMKYNSRHRDPTTLD
jgi:hypothetical protein